VVLTVKVGQGFGISKDIMFSQKEVRSTGTTSFQKILLETQTNSAKEQLNTLLEGIQKQGERLARSRKFQDLQQYKRLIKSFLQDVVKFGLSLEETTSFGSMSSRERKLLVIKEIDHHLLELSKEILESEDENLRLLDKIGEIKGMLIDLYL
jgi:uncharacterized protein